MLPTIAIPEPMQELGPVFVVGCRVGGGSSTVVGCRLGGGSSTTGCCCCNALSTAACAAVSLLSFSGALLLNMSVSVFRQDSRRKGQSRLPAIEREPRQSLLLPRRENPQVRTLENRTAQSRMPPRWSLRFASHSTYGAVSGISLPDDLGIGTGFTPAL